MEYGELNSNNHEYGTLISSQPEVHTATELKPAVAAHYHCACGKYFTESKVETTLEALTGEKPDHSGSDDGDCTTAVVCKCGYVITPAKSAHDWSKLDGKCATPGCTATCDGIADSNHDHACDTCGKPVTTCADNLAPVTGQTASCKVDGWKDYYTCSICRKNYFDASAQNEITDLDAWKAGEGKIPAAHVGKTHIEYEPIYNSATETYNLGDHSINTVCDTCGTPLSAKLGAHKWVKGICEDCKLVCPHSGGTATCVDKAICEICGQPYGEVASSNHTYGTLISAQPEVHTKTELKSGIAAHYLCACGKYFDENKLETTLEALTGEKPDHSGSDDGDCTTAVLCKCGYVITPAKSAHDWSKLDGKCATPGCTATCDGIADSNHDHACDTCGKPVTTCADNLTPVTGQTASCKKDGWKDYYTCSICRKIYSDASAQNEITDLDAWKAGEGKIPAAHVGKTHTEYEPIYYNQTESYNLDDHSVITVCDTCGDPIGVVLSAHKWVKGICEDCELVCPHSGTDDGDCNTAIVCDICGEELEEAQSHWFSQWKPCSDGYHAAYCLRKGCDGAAGLPCEWFELTFTTSDEDEMTVSICPVCGAIRGEDIALSPIVKATVKANEKWLPWGELIVRGMENPYGECQYLFTVGYEYSGWLEDFLGTVTVTIPMEEPEGDFRLVYVDTDEETQEQILTEVECTIEEGMLTFETEKQGIFLILPVSE